MWLPRAFLVCLGIAAFTWLGFRYFPGHTYLQSDTQIYLPMLERLDDPGFLARDIVATRPHIAFTVYDEVTLSLHKTAHLDFRQALVGQQLLFRAAAMLGAYLIATSVGTPPAFALLIAGLLNLGASLLGPAVLSVEYEPVPRAFAFGLVLLAIGLLAHRYTLLAGLAGGSAFLYHPPTSAPFWGIVFLAFICDRQARRRWKPLLLVFLIACLLLANLAQLQPDTVETQNFFGRLSERMIELQHFRTRYSWVSLWAPVDIWHYTGLCLCALWASSRIWPDLRPEMRWFFLCLPIGGVLCVPLSYLMLEHFHLAITPQFQPARALLYTVVMASVTCGMAAVKAARRRHVFEAIAWFLVVMALPVNVRLFDLFSIRDRLALQAFAVWVGLAVLAGLFVLFFDRKWLRAVPLVVPAVAAFAIPAWAGVSNYPIIDKRFITEVALWAKKDTWGSSMFLFPDAGHEPFPGIFRALSERALYVDWKSGGQVNYFESFADEWYPRFEQTMDGQLTAARLEDMLSLPIDYYVLRRKHAIERIKPVFANRDYLVYDAQDLRNASTSLRIGTDD
jgi:hypothetical protein